LPSDIVLLQKELAIISVADDNQELKRAGAPKKTEDRNRTARSILDAVGRISGAGALQFAKDEDLRNKFAALSPSPGSGKRKRKTTATSSEAKDTVKA
jgi:hypothetical protein